MEIKIPEILNYSNHSVDIYTAYKHSITPECILPYTIHLLARDPDSHDGVLRKHVISRIKESVITLISRFLCYSDFMNPFIVFHHL